MAWGKVDDRLHSHPKPEEAGLEAMGLWALALSYCCDQLTNGVVTKARVAKLAGDPKVTARTTARLVATGLWHPVDGECPSGHEDCDRYRAAGDGFRFHDWADYQPTREAVESERNRKRANLAAHRNRRRGETAPETGRATGNETGPETGFTTGSQPSRNHGPSPYPKISSGSSSPLLPLETPAAAAPTIQDMVVTGLRAHASLAHALTPAVVEALEGDLAPRALKRDEIAQAFQWAAKRALAESAGAGGGPLVVDRVVDLVLSAFASAKTVGRRKLDARAVSPEIDPDLDDAKRAAREAAKKRLGGEG